VSKTDPKLKYSLKFKGFIFDVDDTILDNKSGIPGSGLHEKSRLEACRIVGEELGIKELSQITLQENLDCFNTAPVHSVEGGIWNLLSMKGLVNGDVIEKENELMLKIIRLKEELHANILLNEAEEVEGAVEFIKNIYDSGYADKLAIASSATRRDIDLFFGKTGLDKYFLDKRIISKENFTHTKPNPEPFNLAFETLDIEEKFRKNVLAFDTNRIIAN
jgi:phosphoglycolate phosphatase-like HAD superfamily hydrolase